MVRSTYSSRRRLRRSAAAWLAWQGVRDNGAGFGRDSELLRLGPWVANIASGRPFRRVLAAYGVFVAGSPARALAL